MKEVGDGVFSEGVMGEGVAILPENNVLRAPADGIVSVLMENSRHACGLTLDNGMEILLHVGIDTVDMNGDGFEYLVREGQRVHAGDAWITPFFPSPQRDNGYDVADYTSVDPRFGTMENLEELIAEADRRHMGIMLDMVFNHTSTQHKWFQKALEGEKKYQDYYYIWREGTADRLPTNWESKFGGPAWEYVPSFEKWYLHLFDITQADLNWENPQVREELKNLFQDFLPIVF